MNHPGILTYSRGTFTVRDQVGDGKTGASLKLESDQGVVAERLIYFNYGGLVSNNWKGGHCVVGANSPQDTCYFAEGTTRGGFEEWLCIQNPGNTDAAVAITYYPEGGAPIVKQHTVGAYTRETVDVNTPDARESV